MSNHFVIQELYERNLIAQITNKNLLIKSLSTSKIAVYCGFDPTANSLHLGHLIPLLCLRRFQLAGHIPIVLIGGATGLIGDPSFRETERKLNSIENLNDCTKKIKKQVLAFIDFDCGINSAIIVNNYDWFSKINLVNFLRNIGKYFSVNQMINKKAIKQRLNRNNTGISFSEFSYNLLQSYDFSYLNNKYGVTLQIGGSDQWGNIISGINLTKHLNHKVVYGLTTPLITKTNGIKYSKTSSDIIWLDPTKTSPYKFYQFWVNISDNDVYRFLRMFTFLDLKKICELEQDNQYNQIFNAQHLLAEEITRLVHGDQQLAIVKRVTKNLFNGIISDLTEEDFIQLSQGGIPTFKVIYGADLLQILIISGIAMSRNQARYMINSHAISVNGVKWINKDILLNKEDIIYGRYTLLRKGKKQYYLIHWQ